MGPQTTSYPHSRAHVYRPDLTSCQRLGTSSEMLRDIPSVWTGEGSGRPKLRGDQGEHEVPGLPSSQQPPWVCAPDVRSWQQRPISQKAGRNEGVVHNPDTGKSMEIDLEQGAYTMALWVPKRKVGGPRAEPGFTRQPK